MQTVQLVNLGVFGKLAGGVNQVAHGIGDAVVAAHPKKANAVNKGLGITDNIVGGAGKIGDAITRLQS